METNMTSSIIERMGVRAILTVAMCVVSLSTNAQTSSMRKSPPLAVASPESVGMSTERFARGEIGARRHLSKGTNGSGRWDAQLGEALSAMGQVLAPEGLLLCLIGDGQFGRYRMDAGRQLRRLAPEVGLSVLASARQERPDHRGGAPRGEHLLALGHLDAERAPSD